MRKGDTLIFPAPPVLLSWAAVGGKREGEGPLAEQFDRLTGENTLGEKSWEAAESNLAGQAVALALKKGQLTPAQISLAFGGDLQAQCTATAYAIREMDIPYVGLYGACSTITEGLALAACFCAAGQADRALAVSSSHFCAAERQFRTPLEYGGKRTPTAQWTATAAGCCVAAPAGKGPHIGSVTFGRVKDYEVTDINNMGAAMAPAAAETILRHLRDTETTPAQYDAIFTGDLGQVGSALLLELLAREKVYLTNHRDCGLLLYDVNRQQVHAGGSGAGCSAAVLCCKVLPELAAGKLKRVLFLSTGALMSQTTFLQGESIPAIAPCVELLGEEGKL